jgi:hypothetical protein
MMLALFYAIPAAVLALLVYFQLRQPDVPPREQVLLRWALVLGVCAWLPVLALALTPTGWLLPGVWRNVAGACGIVSNAMNVLAIVISLRARSAKSLFSAALLGLNQLALILSAFAAQIP